MYMQLRNSRHANPFDLTKFSLSLSLSLSTHTQTHRHTDTHLKSFEYQRAWNRSGHQQQHVHVRQQRGHMCRWGAPVVYPPCRTRPFSPAPAPVPPDESRLSAWPASHEASHEGWSRQTHGVAYGFLAARPARPSTAAWHAKRRGAADSFASGIPCASSAPA